MNKTVEEHKKAITEAAKELNKAIMSAWEDDLLTYVHVAKACDLDWACHAKVEAGAINHVEFLKNEGIEEVDPVGYRDMSAEEFHEDYLEQIKQEE